MFDFDIDLGDTSDYDEETLENANKAFFYCEEDRNFEAAEPYLKAAADKRYSYSMVAYAFYLLLEKKCLRKERLCACDFLLQAAIRNNEEACEFLKKRLDRQSKEQINSLVRSVKTENLNHWIRGKIIDDLNDQSKLEKAIEIIYKFVCTKRLATHCV